MLSLLRFLLCWSLCSSAVALDVERTIEQLYHSGWTIRSGAPGQVSALAQTADGYLWLASGGTLYQFDGVKFQRLQLPGGATLLPGAVSALRATPDGALWIGYQFGGISVLRARSIVHYTSTEGAPWGTVDRIAVDHEGTVWASTYVGLVRFDGKRWRQIGSEWNYHGKTSRSVFVDRDGVLWVADESRLLYLPRGARSFLDTGEKVAYVGDIAQAPDGAIWIAEANGKVRAVVGPLGAPLVRRPELAVSSAGIVFDRDGALWLGTLGAGMRRVAHPEQFLQQKSAPRVEVFTRENGLTSDYTWPVLEDREGNLWFGSSAGIDRFRTSALIPAELPSAAHDFALAAGADGALWAGASNHPVMRLHRGKLDLFDLKLDVSCVLRDHDGAILLGSRAGVWRVAEGEAPRKHIELPADAEGRELYAITRDRTGRLWASIARHGLYRFDRGEWTHLGTLGLAAPGTGAVPIVALTDARGRVWFGMPRSRVFVIDGERPTLYSNESGLALGNISALHQGREHVWIGGSDGVAFFDGATFRPIHVSGAETLRGVAALIERDDGLWVHGTPGVFHIPPQELARAVADSNYRAQARLFDFLDGLPGRPTQIRPLPTAVETSDGRLWFATSAGVAWIDPASIRRNPTPPPVIIEAVTSDGRSFEPASSVAFPKRTTRLQIDYAGLSLSIPERVRFRYRLDGVDEQWQEAGARRQAIYTNLEPGAYRFRVIAANEDGVWNETGAAFDFTIAPAFTQTTLFRALCVLAALIVAFMLHRVRLGVLARRMQSRLEERVGERERIARELHDSLLQGIQGLILRVHGVARALTDEAAKSKIEEALDRAEEALVEGRDRVKNLRGPTQPSDDLADSLARFGAELAEDKPIPFRVIVEGDPTKLHPILQDELYRIGREALINAFQHSGAEQIEVELTYDRRALRLCIRDDGRGIDVDVLAARRRTGHWGLSGMEERARKVGARFNLRSRPQAGVEIELSVPAKLAYAEHSRPWWRRF